MVADQILVKEGDQAGQVLMKLDTEASEEQRWSGEDLKLKKEQLSLKEEEKRNYLQVNQEELQMLENVSRFSPKFWSVLSSWSPAGAYSSADPNQQNTVAEIRGR